MTSEVIRKFVVLGASSATCVLSYFVLDMEFLGVYGVRIAYWLTLALVCFSGYYFCRALPGLSILRSLSKQHAFGLLVILACSVYLHLFEPHFPKTTWDDYSFISNSLNMHLTRTEGAPIRLYDFISGYDVIESSSLRRPLLFPFLVSVLHDLTGFRPANVLILNGILTPVFLLLVYSLGTLMAKHNLPGDSVSGKWFGVVGVLLTSSLPLLSQTVTGAGYDILNLALIPCVIIAGYRYLTTPADRYLELFILSLILLASTRMESALYLLLLLPVVLLKWHRERAVQFSWFAALSPLLLLPTVWVLKDYTSDFAVGINEAGQLGDKYFSLGNLSQNLINDLVYLLHIGPWKTNSFQLSLAGMLCLPFCLLFLIRRLRQDSALHLNYVVLSTLLLVMLSLVATQSYYWSSFNTVSAERFSLPLYLLFILAILIFLISLQAGREGGNQWVKWVTLAAALNLVFLTTPVVARHYATSQLQVARSAQWEIDYLKEHFTSKERAVFVLARSSLHLTANRIPSSWIYRVNVNPAWLSNLLELGVYEDVLVLRYAHIETLPHRITYPREFGFVEHFNYDILARKYIVNGHGVEVLKIHSPKETLPASQLPPIDGPSSVSRLYQILPHLP